MSKNTVIDALLQASCPTAPEVSNLTASSLPPGFKTSFNLSESEEPRADSSALWAEKETARVLSTLERGDVVKVGSTKWAVFRKNDNTTVTVYKWPSKKTKIYFIQLEEDEATLGDNVVVYPVGGSGQRIGPDVAKGKLTPVSVQRGGANLDASSSKEPNTVVVEVYNIGDADYGEEDWVVDVGWAFVEGNSTQTSGAWTTDRYPLPKAVTQLLGDESRMSRADAVNKAKKIVQVLKSENVPFKAKAIIANAEEKAEPTEDADTEVKLTAGRLIDLTVFFLALDLAQQMAEGNPTAAHMSQSGMPLANRFQASYVSYVNAYLTPLFDSWGLKAFKQEWRRLERPKKNVVAYADRAKFVLRVLDRLRTKPDLLRQTFTDGRTMAAARRLAEVNDVESPMDRLAALTTVPPVGNLPATRLWTKSTAKGLSINIPEFDETLADVAQAADLGQQVKNVDVQLAHVDEEAIASDLKKQRTELVRQIEKVAEASPNPQAVMTSALEAARVTPETGQLRTKTAKSLSLNPQQEDAMIADGKVVIAAGAGSGKCVTGDTLVTTADGVHRIDSPLSLSTKMVSVDADNLTVSSEEGQWLDMGESPIIEIVTRSGVKIRGTPEHPLLVWDGKPTWTKLQDMKAGDHVLLFPGHASETGQGKIDPDEAYLLGLWMGNGWMSTKPWRCSWSCHGDLLTRQYYALSAKFWGGEPQTYNGKEHFQDWKAVVERLLALGIEPADGRVSTNARAKKMPLWLHAASRQERVRFLQGLFDTDGTCSDDRCFEWLSASESLARDVHQMLIGLGVVGTLRPKTVDGYDWTYWRVIVSGDQARALNDNIGFRYALDKQEKLDALTSKVSNPNVGCYPHVGSVLKSVRESWKAAGVWNGREQAVLMDDRWVSVKDYLQGARKPSKRQILRMVGDLDDAEASLLRNLTSFYPDEVVSVTPCGVEHVYDYTVPTTHSFIANGVVSHNTRVLAGKVVYLVKEKGVPTSSILATSFTRKSARELKDRINKYAGSTIIDRRDVASQGFGTTHSISAKLMSWLRPDIKLPEGSSGYNNALLKIALKQVELAPSSQVPSAPPDEHFFAERFLRPFARGADAAAAKPSVSFPDALKAGIAWLNTPSDTLNRFKNQPWILRWKETNPTYDIVHVSRDIAERALQRNTPFYGLSDKQQQNVLKLFKWAGISFNPDEKVEASVVSAAAKKKFSEYKDKPANQFFNIGIGRIASNEAWNQEYVNDFTVGKLSRAMSIWKGNLVSPSEAWAKSPSLAAAAYAAYEWLKENDPAFEGASDSDDLLINFSRLMIADPKSLGKLQQRFKHVLVDEAQDLNGAQHLLFGMLSGYVDPVTRKPHADGRMTAETYAMIGDDKQCIYSFRGADVSVFISKSDLKGGDFKTKFVDVNYRSGRVIVEAANHIISHNQDQIPMVCKAGGDRGEGVIQAKRVPDMKTALALTASAIQTAAKSETGDNKYLDYGVLTRTNNEAYGYALEMLRRGIPFRSKFNPLTNIMIKSILNWLLLIKIDAQNTGVMNAVVKSILEGLPKFGVSSDKMTERLTELTSPGGAFAGKSFYEALVNGAWQQIYVGRASRMNDDNVLPLMTSLKVVKESGLTSSREAIDFVLNNVVIPDGGTFLDLLKNDAKQNDDSDDEENRTAEMSDENALLTVMNTLRPIMDLADTHPDLTQYLGYIKQLKAANEKLGHDDTGKEEVIPDAVVIDTVHGWKGLESKHVFVTMTGGSFPDMRSDIQDERRLAYVALTRGQDSVTIWSPETNSLNKPVAPSQFISEACLSFVEDKAQSTIAEPKPVSGSVEPFDLWSES